MNNITPEVLAGAAGILLSLIANYVPKFNAWFAAKKSEVKSLIMLGSLVVITTGIVALSCTKLWIIATCDQPAWIALGKSLVLAMIANQGMYLISPQTKKVIDKVSSRML